MSGQLDDSRDFPADALNLLFSVRRSFQGQARLSFHCITDDRLLPANRSLRPEIHRGVVLRCCVYGLQLAQLLKLNYPAGEHSGRVRSSRPFVLETRRLRLFETLVFLSTIFFQLHPLYRR